MTNDTASPTLQRCRKVVAYARAIMQHDPDGNTITAKAGGHAPVKPSDLRDTAVTLRACAAHLDLLALELPTGD